MKENKKIICSALVLMLMACFTLQLQAQTYGKLKGKAIKVGSEAGPIEYADIKLYSNGTQLGTVMTDDQGMYSIPNLEPGTYDVALFVDGTEQMRKTGAKVTIGTTTFSNFEVANYTMDAVILVPEIDFAVDEVISGTDIGLDEIENWAGGRQPVDFIMVSSEINAPTGNPLDGFSIRGARTTATAYFVDGVKVIGPTTLPNRSIGGISVITGGIPAEYGDVTGGIIAITTRHGMQIPKYRSTPVKKNTKDKTKPRSEYHNGHNTTGAYYANSY